MCPLPPSCSVKTSVYCLIYRGGAKTGRDQIISSSQFTMSFKLSCCVKVKKGLTAVLHRRSCLTFSEINKTLHVSFNK